MLILNKFDVERIRHQPSILTYHNLANVCALAESPRIIIDTDNGVNSYWAANIPIEDYVGGVFTQMYFGNHLEVCDEVNMYPIIYKVSDEERENMMDVLEIEDKYYLSGVLINYRCRKSQGGPIDMMPKEKADNLPVIEYGIFIDQSIDGAPYNVQELISILLATGLRQHRRIKNCPHEEIPVNIIIPESLAEMALDVSEENPMSIPAMTANLRDYIIRKITDNDEDPESNYAVSSINTKVLEISVVKETTKRSKVRTLPLVYDEVYSAYGASFDCNRYNKL